ncbi:MAG: 30S ribosomal protein S3 [Candidatus Caccovivens sp.]
MGQKVNPIGLRLGINKDWQSTWYANKQDFAANLKEDHDIREYFHKKHSGAGISEIQIKRTENKLEIDIYTGKPGMIIGSKGAGIEAIKKDLNKMVKPVKNLVLNVKEVKKPDLDARLVADSIAQQLEKRVQWRRALKQAIQRVMKAGAKGCKVQVSGVIDGANTIARTEKYMEGSLPLHTLRADIDYAESSAFTNYGKLGIKCWIYRGEILSKQSIKEDKNNVNA